MEEDWCPKRAGEFKGYQAEWLEGGKWKAITAITLIDNDMRGAPYPALFGGVLQTVGLQGYSQATSLAWNYSAIAEAKGKEVKVRVTPFEVVYDIKARKINDKETPDTDNK